jgi:hypothetical protein
MSVLNELVPVLEHHVAAACPCCGSPASLWERVGDRGTSKAVMCSNGTPLVEGEGNDDTLCPMWLPPEGMYQATRREAIDRWNSFAAALVLRRASR